MNLSVASRPLPFEGGAVSTDGGRRWWQAPARVSAPAPAAYVLPPPFQGRRKGGGSNPVLSASKFGRWPRSFRTESRGATGVRPSSTDGALLTPRGADRRVCQSHRLG